MPLVVADADEKVLYGRDTKVEFTPFEGSANLIGHAIALTPTTQGVKPELSVNMRQYMDNPKGMGLRQGISLSGTDQFGNGVTWYVNAAADRFLMTLKMDDPDYDEETANLLEKELGTSELQKVNLNTFY